MISSGTWVENTASTFMLARIVRRVGTRSSETPISLPRITVSLGSWRHRVRADLVLQRFCIDVCTRHWGMEGGSS